MTLCERDGAGAAGDEDGLGQPVQPVDGDDDVGRLGRGRGTPCAHGDTDVRDGQGGRVVDAVADHHDRSARHSLLLPDRLDLVAGGPVGQHAVETHRGPDEVREGAWSPVTMRMRVNPARRRLRTARGVSGRMGSSSTSAPVTRPSTRT